MSVLHTGSNVSVRHPTTEDWNTKHFANDLKKMLEYPFHRYIGSHANTMRGNDIPKFRSVLNTLPIQENVKDIINKILNSHDGAEPIFAALFYANGLQLFHISKENIVYLDMLNIAMIQYAEVIENIRYKTLDSILKRVSSVIQNRFDAFGTLTKCVDPQFFNKVNVNINLETIGMDEVYRIMVYFLRYSKIRLTFMVMGWKPSSNEDVVNILPIAWVNYQTLNRIDEDCNIVFFNLF